MCRALIGLIIYGWPVGLVVCEKLLWGHSSPSADVAFDCVAVLLIQRRFLWLAKWIERRELVSYLSPHYEHLIP